MKLLLFFLGTLACAADLASVHKVYLMPMPRGLDQYLANRLAGGHLFLVVTDPKLADAVFTDRLGEAFEIQLVDFTAPKTPEPVAKPADNNAASMFTDTVNKVSSPALNSSWGRARGTVFLVDAKSRSVVWSTYDPPRGTTAGQLDRTASDIVGRIKKDLNLKK